MSNVLIPRLVYIKSSDPPLMLRLFDANQADCVEVSRLVGFVRLPMGPLVMQMN